MKQSAHSDSWKMQSGCVDHEHLLTDEKLQTQIIPSGEIFLKQDLDCLRFDNSCTAAMNRSASHLYGEM